MHVKKPKLVKEDSDRAIEVYEKFINSASQLKTIEMTQECYEKTLEWISNYAKLYTEADELLCRDFERKSAIEILHGVFKKEMAIKILPT